MDFLASAAIAATFTLTCAFLVAQVAAAADNVHGSGGVSTTPRAAKPSAAAPVVIPSPIAASFVFNSAQYATGGVALRNRRTGGIEVSGAVSPIKAAYIYWAVMPRGAGRSIRLTRTFPGPAAFKDLTGTEVGHGPSPCWNPPGSTTTISVYRAAVPLNVANGNGSYTVNLTGASGLTGGEDPWSAPVVFPLFEGASLVIVGTGASTVALYDNKDPSDPNQGISGHFFNAGDGISYSLQLPNPVSGGPVLFDNIGADGQHGAGRGDIAAVSREVTTINGVKIAGPGSPANDTDWNGSAGFPLPQLWDDTGHDVTAAAKAGTARLDVSISAAGGPPNDCLTAVANIVSFPAAGASR
ncbi:MAG: hypothetical protein L0Y57_07680 [Beijerinckiaceae bacterium]|nr:hypothetical protein [Beijerinckiaceae bacterium]